MTEYYKVIDNGYIIGIGTHGNDTVTAITEAEYGELLTTIKTAPFAPSGYAYLLNADTLEWDLVEVEPEPEPEDAEISDYEQALADLGVRLE